MPPRWAVYSCALATYWTQMRAQTVEQRLQPLPMTCMALRPRQQLSVPKELWTERRRLPPTRAETRRPPFSTPQSSLSAVLEPLGCTEPGPATTTRALTPSTRAVTSSTRAVTPEPAPTPPARVTTSPSRHRRNSSHSFVSRSASMGGGKGGSSAESAPSASARPASAAGGCASGSGVGIANSETSLVVDHVYVLSVCIQRSVPRHFLSLSILVWVWELWCSL